MSPKHAKPRPRLRASMLTPVALLLSSAMVYQASNAAFSAKTDNGTNTWAAGSVQLTDNDSQQILFEEDNLFPGSSKSKCIRVDYTSTAPSDIRLYVTEFVDGGLADYLDFVVDEGSAAPADCTGFTKSSNAFTGTLKEFSAKSDWASGIESWKPTGTASKTYRFTYTLKSDASDTVQGKSSSAAFVWEAKTS